jgi:cytidylate kinase
MVYHGFAGHFFVGDVSHVLKVRITADLELRLDRMMKREGVSPDKAAWLVKQVDEERKRWSAKLYGIDTWDCRLYDMVINIGRISIDHAVDLICQTIQQTAYQTTPDSKARIEKMAEEALAKIEDKDFVSPFFEPMRDSPWRKKRELK